MTKALSRIACALLLAAPAAPVPAQSPADFPCKTVSFVVPYPPGGASDLLARMLAPGLTERLGPVIVVENKAGAAGNIGTGHVSSADPDGCTWLLGNSSGIVISRNLYKLPKDPVESLTPVAEVAAIPMVLYVHDSVPATNLHQFVEHVKANPDKYAYATPGSGTTHHLLGELLKLDFGLAATHVPYRGSGPAIQDMLAGRTAFAFEGTSAVVPHLSSGRIRALATTGQSRSGSLPDVPTMRELGHENFVVTNWYGVFVPAGTPADIVERLNEAVRETLKTPAVADSLARMDSQAVGYTPQEYRAFVLKEAPFWTELVQRSGATVD